MLLSAGKFMKTIYDTTMTEYKSVLERWNKGTGGGPGLNVYFQSWDKEKLDKYDIDLNTCDHTAV